jgi:hypothetical protein
MTLNIDTSNKDKVEKILKEKFLITDEKGNLKNHFGKLKRGIDGLKFQKDSRKNED